MKFKIGDRVKIVSLKNTKYAFGLDGEGFMETALRNTYIIEDIDARYVTKKVYLSFRDKYSGSYMWHEDDLILVNNKLEIE